MSHSFAYIIINNDVRIDAAAGCGKRFEGIAWILDYRTHNPSLKCEKGLGLIAVQEILDRAKQGF